MEERQYIAELQDRYIDVSMDTRQAPCCLTWQDKDVASFGDLLSIIGPEKSRKSLLVDSIISSAYNPGEYYGLGFNLDLKGKAIVHIDTEQPIRRVVMNRRRLYWMCENEKPPRRPNGYHSYSLRPYHYYEIIDQVEHILTEKHTNVGLLVLDQIADMVPEINDTEGANNLLKSIMKWQDQHGCLVIVVMHTNRGRSSSN